MSENCTGKGRLESTRYSGGEEFIEIKTRNIPKENA